MMDISQGHNGRCQAIFSGNNAPPDPERGAAEHRGPVDSGEKGDGGGRAAGVDEEDGGGDGNKGGRSADGERALFNVF
ncbi:hypothetical protein NL676_008017 [Syzygium grande]|nr:hypothetical protein NL676_008017 [Syzygium grande]